MMVTGEQLKLKNQHGQMIVVEAEVEQEESRIKQHLIQEVPVTPTETMFTLPSKSIGKRYFKPQIPIKGYVS